MSKGAKGESGKRDVIEAKGKRISREDLGVNMLMLKRNSSVVGTSGVTAPGRHRGHWAAAD